MELTEALAKVKEYQAKLGYDFQYNTREEQMEHIRNLTLAQFQEVSEFLDWTPWKPWRDIHNQECNETEAAYELVDQFFFMTNLWCALGMPIESFEHFFQDKLKENLDRIERGYNKTTETSKQQMELKL